MAQNMKGYSDKLLELAAKPKHFGRMNDPVASAYLKGLCGDDMEFYLDVSIGGVIEDISFYTQNGCLSTKACGEMAARLSENKNIEDIMALSPKKIMEALEGELPETHRHCAILAVSALHKAVAQYLLQP